MKHTALKHQLLNTPIPEQTRTYKPISHKELIDLTLESIHQSGFKVEKEKYSSAKDGNVANGKYVIENVKDSEMQLQIAWQNSYDKSLTLKFALGVNIMICENGCVSGDFGSFKKKHVGDIQTFTPDAITEYIKRSGEVFEIMQRDKNQLKRIQINDKLSAAVLGRLFFNEDVITSSQMNIIKDQIKNPTYDYNSPGSAWELYNHVTYAMRSTHPSYWIDKHKDLHNFFMSN